MKNKLIYAGAAAALATSFLVAITPALAAPAVLLQHAGVGQKAGDTANFGVAICNNGTQSVPGATPFQVTANGKAVNATVAGPLAAGACKYTYLAYSSFGMTVGNTYSVVVSIDPSHTVTTNTDAPATYSITVPSAGKVLGASTMSDAERQSLLAQLASMVTILQGLLTRLLGR
jgi:hypothetical protein